MRSSLIALAIAGVLASGGAAAGTTTVQVDQNFGSAAIVPVPRDSTKPARPRVSCRDPWVRSAVITASAQAPIRTVVSRAIGSPSASRSRRR